jgi:phospholipid transport system substrate-binding protein
MRGLRWLAAIITLASLLSQVALGQSETHDSSSDTSAVLVVERLLNALVAAAALSDLDERVDFLTEPVLTSHDFAYIGQLTVRRQWRDWSEAQRGRFLDAFTTFSVMSYATRFSGVGEGSFEVLGAEDAGRSRVQVNTTVARADGSAVPIDYILQQADGEHWRIANVVADGVSDLALKRAEYSSTLSSSGFEGLIEALESQTAELLEGVLD